MTIQLVNVGTTADDGTGDPLRTAYFALRRRRGALPHAAPARDHSRGCGALSAGRFVHGRVAGAFWLRVDSDAVAAGVFGGHGASVIAQEG